jgi:NIMA (never in mitosis gene a)-related kinase
MEYAAGGDLYNRIIERRSKRLPFRKYKIKEWFSGVLLAMDFLHKNKIYHRDMKTANVLIVAEGDQEVLKICDFGLSKQNEETSKAANTKVGTRQYMSPEVLRGQEYKKDADIWSLGCVLFEMWCVLN